MTLRELINRFRIMAFDKVEPYFFSDEEIAMWLNDAEREACIRGRLIRDFSTAGVAEIPMLADTAYYELHPAFYEIEHIGYEYNPPLAHDNGDDKSLTLISQEDMMAVNPLWRNRGEMHHLYGNDLRYAVQYDKGVRLVPTPKFGGMLYA